MPFRLGRLPLVMIICLAIMAPASAQDGKASTKNPSVKKGPEEKSPSDKDADKLPLTKLKPSKIAPNLCLLKYRVSTSSTECQAFIDQGLAYYYSYVWMEAARSFETATKLDPNCAVAWWGLSKALEKWGRGNHQEPLKKVLELLPKTTPRESLLIKSRLAEKGMLPGVGPDQRRKEAIKYLDELLTLYDEDEEGWFARAQLAEGPNASVPFYKALLRVNPVHPGAHHELVHHYENIQRPALGWLHAEGYIQSSPGIPHAFHMQAHLAMRIGRWEKTTDRSARAIELQRAYHKTMEVKPAEDWQFAHHLETLMTSLTHDARFIEAKEIKKLCEGYNIHHRLLWFRMHLAERDYEEALKQVGHLGKNDKLTGSYLRALVYLKKGDLDRAEPEVHVLREAYQNRRKDLELELRFWETQGMLQACRGQEGGLKLLQQAVNKTKDEYGRHSWGGGAYFMERWGEAALKANRLEIAEEAFLEALAHDTGSARGALGMQVVCERLQRTEESLRFAELAQRSWRRAETAFLLGELNELRGMKQPPSE